MEWVDSFGSNPPRANSQHNGTANPKQRQSYLADYGIDNGRNGKAQQDHLRTLRFNAGSIVPPSFAVNERAICEQHSSKGSHEKEKAATSNNSGSLVDSLLSRSGKKQFISSNNYYMLNKLCSDELKLGLYSNEAEFLTEVYIAENKLKGGLKSKIMKKYDPNGFDMELFKIDLDKLAIEAFEQICKVKCGKL